MDNLFNSSEDIYKDKDEDEEKLRNVLDRKKVKKKKKTNISQFSLCVGILLFFYLKLTRKPLSEIPLEINFQRLFQNFKYMYIIGQVVNTLVSI